MLSFFAVWQKLRIEMQSLSVQFLKLIPWYNASNPMVKPASTTHNENDHTTFRKIVCFDFTGMSSVSYTTAGKHKLVIHPKLGRTSSTFPKKNPTMAPPMCMKLSTRGIRPYIKLVAVKKMMDSRVCVLCRCVLQFTIMDDSVAPSKPMKAADGPTEMRPCRKRAESMLPPKPLSMYVSATWKSVFLQLMRRSITDLLWSEGTKTMRRRFFILWELERHVRDGVGYLGITQLALEWDPKTKESQEVSTYMEHTRMQPHWWNHAPTLAGFRHKLRFKRSHV